jgi:peroxiredoxin
MVKALVVRGQVSELCCITCPCMPCANSSVTFYRGGWCPYCNLELRAYQPALPQIEAAGARLVAISPESPDDALTTLEKNSLRFEVLPDTVSILRLRSRPRGLIATRRRGVLARELHCIRPRAALVTKCT